MNIFLVDADMDLSELAAVTTDIAVLGSFVGILTTRGMYVMHLERINYRLSKWLAAKVHTLATDHGMDALAISRHLGVSHKFARDHHPRCVHDARKTPKERATAVP